MPDGKVRLNLEWLSDCGGCHVAIVDLHEKILDVLGAVDILHCPVLTDVKDYPDADVGLMSGAIRNEHDRHIALEMRRSCKLLIAFGTCALYGGIPGVGSVHGREELLDSVYRHGKTTRSAAPPSLQVSPLEETVIPVDEVVEVDLYLPGCPPHPSFILKALQALIEGKTPATHTESVCARCKRRMARTEVTAIRRTHEGLPDHDVCFLSQGYLCMGSVTLDRCVAPCPNNGMMCTGCAGPTPEVLTEPNRDIRTEIADRMSRLTRISRDDIVLAIERTSKTHYAYSMANRMIGRKPTFLIKQWIADVEAEA